MSHKSVRESVCSVTLCLSKSSNTCHILLAVRELFACTSIGGTVMLRKLFYLINFMRPLIILETSYVFSNSIVLCSLVRYPNRWAK
jgi:hypothetical protein